VAHAVSFSIISVPLVFNLKSGCFPGYSSLKPGRNTKIGSCSQLDLLDFQTEGRFTGQEWQLTPIICFINLDRNLLFVRGSFSVAPGGQVVSVGKEGLHLGFKSFSARVKDADPVHPAVNGVRNNFIENRIVIAGNWLVTASFRGG
jgi:hypothetical protein